ncbi:MAG: ATP-dependent helicase, partial [Desulfohalobiaceae bacterium]
METQAIETINEFLEENLPDYILEASRDILSSHGVDKLDLIKRDSYWDIDSKIQGDEFQVYNPEIGINLQESTVNYFCNCPDSFSGVCPHVGATMLYLRSSLEENESEGKAPAQRTDWRNSFRSFFATTPEPEAGHTYLLFRFYPEPQRLQVAVYRVRQNKTGLSKIQNPVSFEQLTNNPEWCELSPELPQVAFQVGKYMDYMGQRMDIPTGLTSWFLWSIPNEHFLISEDT